MAITLKAQLAFPFHREKNIRQTQVEEHSIQNCQGHEKLSLRNCSRLEETCYLTITCKVVSWSRKRILVGKPSEI